jgi:hypothetical protein
LNKKFPYKYQTKIIRSEDAIEVEIEDGDSFMA